MFIEIREQLFLRSTNTEITNEIKSLLDKPNPDYLKLKRMGYPTEKVPPRIRMYEIDEGVVIVPRGAWRTVNEVCKKHGVQVSYEDNRTVVDEMEIEISEELTPFWYQEEAINKMIKFQQGMVVAPCGAGKSVIGCAFIARLRKPTIIVVHTLELFKQWEDMVREHLNFPGKIGKIGGGTKTLGNITIAMIQTLVKSSPKEWSEIQSKFEIFIGDESHHFGAESYIKCMRNIRAKYAIGLTATPKRKDKKDFVIHNYLGNVIYEITDSDLEMMGRSLTCKCKIVETKRNYNYTKMNEMLPVLGTVIAKDKTRNEIIVEKIKEDIDDGRTVLVLIERVAHGKILYSLLKQEQIKVELISGAVDANTRSKIKSKMKTGQLEVLVANKAIAAEGLDIPIIDSVHICFWTSNVSLVKQMIGRGRRPYEGKEFCRVWFYKDNVCRTELDGNFREVLREVPTFKYSFSRLTSWLESQSFTVVNDRDHNMKELF